MPARIPAALLFDLDGTLVDSVPDITVAVAELMESEGLAPFRQEEVRRMVGYGLATLVERAFAAHGIELGAQDKASKVEKMMGIYPRHLISRSTLMPGVPDALKPLKEAGGRLAVVTNKPQGAAETVLRHFGIDRYFELIVGDQPLDKTRALAPKPKPDMLLFAVQQLGAAPSAALMIGDSPADIESAAAANIFSVAVRGGYSHVPIESLNPGKTIDRMFDLPMAIDGWATLHQREAANFDRDI